MNGWNCNCNGKATQQTMAYIRRPPPHNRRIVPLDRVWCCVLSGESATTADNEADDISPRGIVSVFQRVPDNCITVYAVPVDVTRPLGFWRAPCHKH